MNAAKLSFHRTNTVPLKWLLLFIIMVVICEGFETGRKPRYVGFDLGTSGARISIIEPASTSRRRLNPAFKEIYSQAIAWNDCGPYDDAESWMKAIEILFQKAMEFEKESNNEDFNGLVKSISSICVSGTSASCLVVDRHSRAVTRSPRMYDYDIISSALSENKRFGQMAIDCIEKHVPPKHTARARTGTLAKLLSWAFQSPWKESEVLCHQSDYVSMMLLEDDDPVKSDWHNCLKLGYDVRNKCWPDWIEQCLEDAGIASPLEKETAAIPMQVVSPGARLGRISKMMADRLGLSHETILVGGTTDSNAAFFAAASVQPELGTAVTSLGSTTAIKLLSRQYVEDADRGVYSHRFPTPSKDSIIEDEEAWLVGGASNAGCVIFRELGFSNEELESLSKDIDPLVDSSVQYYPLVKTGERFPMADANKEPLLEPIPESRHEHLHGLLQSIANIEKDGFIALHELGAPVPKQVYTCGGGSKNIIWSQMRQRILSQGLNEPNIKVEKAKNTEASYGAGLLATIAASNQASTVISDEPSSVGEIQ